MGDTVNRWTQGTPNPDGLIEVGPSEFHDTSSNATYASSAAGFFTLNLASTAAGTFFADLGALLKRTGVYATPANSQRQFGTAAALPGPSAVSGTSGPLALPAGFPPIKGTSMATVAGPTSGPGKKGIQINSLDVVYEVNTVNASTATIGLTTTAYVNAAAPTVVSLITLGANGLPVAFGTTGRPYVKNIAVANPAMIITPDMSVVLNVNLTAGSGGTIKFHRVFVNCSFNFN